MKTIISYEWKKIFSRRFNVLVMLAGYVLTIVCIFNYICQYNYYDEGAQDYIHGISAYQQKDQLEHSRTDFLTEEYLTQVVSDIQSSPIQDLESDEAYTQLLRQNYDMLSLIGKNYMDLREVTDFNVLRELSAEDGIGFYERRTQKLADYLNMDFSFGNYSQAEKDYWMQKEQSVATPFAWGSRAVADMLESLLGVMFYFLFVIGVCVAPVFASEYESGAAALLLTTRYGKNRLIFGKIAAAVTFAIGYVALAVGIQWAAVGLTVGYSGLELPVQLWETTIPYDWSMGTALLAGTMIMLLVVLAFTLVTLLISARTRLSLIPLAVGFLLVIAPAFFPMSKEFRIWNQINYLFPVRLISIKDILSTFNSYQFGPVIISYVGMIVIVYVLVSVLCLPWIKKGFVKHS